jgi:predicted metalloprotease with PDZ domain
MTKPFCFRSCLILAVVVLAVGGTHARAQGAPTPVVTLVVDETQAARRITFVHEEIRVRPGPLTLAYPLWIPGEHGPTGTVPELASIRIRSGETALAWKRDPDEISTIRVEVPANADRISIDFDTLIENTISDHQLLLSWNTVVLYPRSIDKRQLMIDPSILLPPNWQQGSSLTVTGNTSNRVDFAPVSLERLIDSPVLAGEFFKAVPLGSVWPAELDLTGDNQFAIDHADDAHAFSLFAKLVDQDRAMFGFRHWKTLHLLVSQSAAAPFDGLEHEDSPWDAVGDAGLSKKDVLEKVGWPLLAHEQSHSWDGKYRRPSELYSKPDYQGPERATLLWVYEGLNEYIGMLLGTRAGFNDAAYMRDYLGHIAAYYSIEAGRASTPLVDTATENWVLRGADSGWSSIRRSQDYYDEGALIWLRADVQIREQTQGKLSLDDFLRSFLGQRDTDPIVAPYTREDVEVALSAICPYDWHGFFETRIYQVNSKPPTDGIEASGWRVVYNDTPDKETFASIEHDPVYYGEFSVGMRVKKDGMIADVFPGTPAYEAGLGPHMTILAVDGRSYAEDLLNAAIAHPENGKITLTVRNFDSIKPFEIHYAGGVRFPHLERIPGTHDYLSEIFEPRAYKDH